MSVEVKSYEFENFQLDIENKQLIKDGNIVALNHKAFTILLILVRNSGHMTKKEDIIEEVWSDHFVEESNLTQHIYTLRKVLGSNECNESFIKTFPKVGYLFTAEVIPVYQNEKNAERGINENGNGNGHKHLTTDERLENLFTYTPVIYKNGEHSEVKEQSAVNRLFDYKIGAIFAAVLLLGIILVSSFLYLRTVSTPNLAENKVKSIAVLPFKAIVDSEEDKKLGLGMADAVIIKLGKLQQIPVRPTSSVFPYISQPAVNPVLAGQSLGVDTVLEGTVQREGGRIRVTVQLINIDDEKTLWAESFNEDFRDIFTMQDVISERVARSLTKNLTNNQKLLLEQHATNNPAAYQAYALGIYFWNTRTKDGLLKAVDYFKQAIEIDPNYAYAYAGLADSYTMLAYYHYDNSGEMYLPAKEAAIKAINLDATISEAYVALALMQKTFEHDNNGSRLSLEKALELAPYNATARLRYAWQLVADKKMEAAVSEMRQAQEYSPLSPVINTALCEILNYQRDYEEAMIYCKKAEELAPDSTHHRFAAADNLFFSGQPEAAISGLEKCVQKNSKDYGSLVRLAYFYAKTGRKAESTEIYEKLRNSKSDDNRRFIHFANIAFALGKEDESRNYLQQAADNCAIPFFADYDPLFDDIRLDERNKQILMSQCKPSSNYAAK